MQTRAEMMRLPNDGDRAVMEARHRAYYGQFVTNAVTEYVTAIIGRETLMKSINRDGCFNDIPLVQWDRLHVWLKMLVCDKMRKANGRGGYSLGDSVCLAKEAARQWVESNKGTI